MENRMICKYCGFVANSSPMFVIKKAIKPKGYPNRHVTIGYCCEDCESRGMKTYYDYQGIRHIPIMK